MKQQFSNKLGLSKANTDRLDTINEILEEYRLDGYVLTLRQLYYQLVSRDVIANNVKEYAKLSILLTKGRMAGVVDWAAIEDRGRQARLDFYVDSVGEGLEVIYKQYKRNRMDGQEKYIELWIEKDALSNVFSRVTNKYHVRLMVNKGYSSCSAMYEAAKRFKEFGRGKEKVLLYFGDHDASGKDMVRDITDRLEEFRVKNLTVINPALTMTQVNQYSPPENPAKMSDPRAKWYVEKFGNHSWELDALTPQVLIGIATKAILEHIDLDAYNDMLEEEKKDKHEIATLISKYKDVDISEVEEESEDEE